MDKNIQIEARRQLVRWIFTDMETSHPDDSESPRDYIKLPIDIPTLEDVDDLAEKFNCKQEAI